MEKTATMKTARIIVKIAYILPSNIIFFKNKETITEGIATYTHGNSAFVIYSRKDSFIKFLTISKRAIKAIRATLR